MIPQLLLLLAASRVAQAGIGKCPDDSACLYHSRCIEPSPTGQDVLATTDQSSHDSWFTSNCAGSNYPIRSELVIRPISNNKWKIELQYTDNSIVLKFGDDSLTMMANKTEAIFISHANNVPNKITYGYKDLNDLSFTLESSNEKLLDIFDKTKIFYAYKELPGGGWTSSEQPKFWQKLRELTPCDVSLIINDCTDSGKNCTAPEIKSTTVTCPEKEGMWLKVEDSKWKELQSVSCDDKSKDWILKEENEVAVPAPKEGSKIRCATEQPEPWTADEQPIDSTDAVSSQSSTAASDANGILPTFIVPIFLYLINI